MGRGCGSRHPQPRPKGPSPIPGPPAGTRITRRPLRTAPGSVSCGLLRTVPRPRAVTSPAAPKGAAGERDVLGRSLPMRSAGWGGPQGRGECGPILLAAGDVAAECSGPLADPYLPGAHGESRLLQQEPWPWERRTRRGRAGDRRCRCMSLRRPRPVAPPAVAVRCRRLSLRRPRSPSAAAVRGRRPGPVAPPSAARSPRPAALRASAGVCSCRPGSPCGGREAACRPGHCLREYVAFHPDLHRGGVPAVAPALLERH